jgi:hypothetical protein
MNSLKELDIPTFGKRFKVQNAINALRDEYFHQMGHSRMSVASLAISEDKKSPTSPMYSQYSYRHSEARRRIHDEEDDYFSIASPMTPLSPITPITPRSPRAMLDRNSKLPSMASVLPSNYGMPKNDHIKVKQ